MTQTATQDLDRLRDRVRATQHLRSFPLLVIGALFVNYGIANFSDQPIAWRYAAPLAFVLVWLLGKINETNVGVGAGRADYLVAAGLVFTATNLLLLRPFLQRLEPGQIKGIWVLIVGVALTAVAATMRDAVVALAGCAVVAVGIIIAVAADATNYVLGVQAAYGVGLWPNELIAVTGGVLALLGLWLYTRERAAA